MRTVRFGMGAALSLVCACTLTQSFTSLTNGECGGAPCSVANGVPACSAAKQCVVQSCFDGFGDCNGDPKDGCEASLRTSPSACGACGVTCEYANAEGACTDGTCSLGTCAPGWADCNADPVDGCETDLQTNAAHCGACGTVCGLCAGGQCVKAAALVSSAHADFTCARLDDGSLACWGDGSSNQLGTGTACGSPPCYHDKPVAVAGLKGATSVAVGSGHGCAVKEGKVLCWGSNAEGQLGLGNPLPDSAPHPAPTEVPDVVDAESVTAGLFFTAVQTKSRGLAVWGANIRGQLGVGSQTPQPGAQAVSGVVSVTTAAAGAEHLCYRSSAGQLYCTGNNEQLALGIDGSRTMQQCGALASLTKCTYSFLDVTGQASTVAIAAGASHTCIARQPSSVACAGSNESGQIGSNGTTGVGAQVGTFTAVFVPAGFGDTIQLVAGAKHTCALQRDGAAWCWGSNASGQLGNASAGALSAIPVRVVDAGGQPLRDLVSIAAGRSHTCVLTKERRVFCFGKNDKAQLGAKPEALASSTQPLEVTVP